MKGSNSFGWMKLFISFQMIIMSSGCDGNVYLFWMDVYTPVTCGKSAWPVTWGCLIYKTGRERCVKIHSGEQRRGKKSAAERRGEDQGGWEGVWCNYVSRQWQVWIRWAMKMIWSGLNCKETATGMVMKICWDDVLCLRIHQTCLVRWKASVIHSVVIYDGSNGNCGLPTALRGRRKDRERRANWFSG